MRTLFIMTAATLLACAKEDGTNSDENDAQSLPTTLTTSHGVTVSYVADPDPIPESSEFSVIFTVSDGSITAADSTMPEHAGHGMTVEPEVIDNGDQTFTAAPFEFHMPGRWEIHATVATATGEEERLDFQVDCCE